MLRLKNPVPKCRLTSVSWQLAYLPVQALPVPATGCRQRLSRPDWFISAASLPNIKWDAYKAEIGIKVKAGAGSKSFVTDTVIFFHNINLTKQDKDVKDLPEQKAEEEQQGTVRQFRGKVAIVIDDCGYDMAPVRKLLNTGLPFSYAILPYKQYSSDVLRW